jgi:hypothetical protein
MRYLTRGEVYRDRLSRKWSKDGAELLWKAYLCKPVIGLLAIGTVVAVLLGSKVLFFTLAVPMLVFLILYFVFLYRALSAVSRQLGQPISWQQPPPTDHQRYVEWCGSKGLEPYSANPSGPMS